VAAPLTTIVVDNYNYARFVRDAVLSAIGQSQPAHVMVIDDASTDDSPEVIRSLVATHRNIEFHPLRVNVGLSRVRNLAATLARTEWILYLDADDWLDTRYIGRAESWLARHPGVDVLTTDMTIVRGDRRRVVRSRVPAFWDDLLRRNTVAQSSLIRRETIAAVGGFDPALVFQDWDFWIRVKQSGGRIGRLPGPHVFWREHGRNMSKVCDERAATAALRHKHGYLESRTAKRAT
jgi:glycosyltransferase involved in cell wall biosynthesis